MNLILYKVGMSSKLQQVVITFHTFNVVNAAQKLGIIFYTIVFTVDTVVPIYAITENVIN